jgi:mannose-6-phosphate isomerase-like protein (cupin superfamily)
VKETVKRVPLRRVVTGFDDAGNSVVAQDGACDFILDGSPAWMVTDLWQTTDDRAADALLAESCTNDITLMPPSGGSVFRVVQFSPDKDYMGKWDADAAFASVGHHTNDAGSQASDAAAGKSGRPKGMHQTDTVDYAIVMSGEIWLVMDEGEVLLKTGDILVQRATNHGWSNRGDVPALVAFVLVDQPNK